MDERLQFVARRLAGEAMAELCREFGISRKTGYKIFDRYQECGIHGSPIEAAVRIVTRTNFHFRSRTSF
jgi:transposase-like protein